MTPSLGRILVIAPNWLGDCLMAQPLLMRIAARLPGAAIDVVAVPAVAPVLRRMPEVAHQVAGKMREIARVGFARQLRMAALQHDVFEPPRDRVGDFARCGLGGPGSTTLAMRIATWLWVGSRVKTTRSSQASRKIGRASCRERV